MGVSVTSQDRSLSVTTGKSNILRLGYLTDTHYDTLVTPPPNRDKTLDYIGNFVTRMAEYNPDIVINAGDKTGITSTVEATQVSWYNSVRSAFALAIANLKVEGVAPANHDFEYMSFSTVLGLHTADTWMESGSLYGAWDSNGFTFISLDAQYEPSTQTHLTKEHNGFGYINTDQLDWMDGILAATSNKVIIFVHQSCAEADTDQFTLTQEVYSVQNRSDFRDRIEANNNVIAVIQGHMHHARAQVYNGIPYITGPAIFDPASFGELPSTYEGEWLTMDFNKDAETIVWRRELYDGVNFQTVYEQTLDWGIVDTTVQTKLKDPTQFLYVLNSSDNVYCYPRNLLNDPYLSDSTIRIQGRTAGVDGDKYFNTIESFGSFEANFNVRFNTLNRVSYKCKHKGGGTASVLRFKDDGTIVAFDLLAETQVSTYAINTWYAIKVVLDVVTQKFSIWIDDVLEAEDFDFTTATTQINTFRITTQEGDSFIDSLIIS